MFIGIDVGTSFIKGAVIDAEKPALSHTERIAFPPFLSGLPHGHREADPAEIFLAVDDLLARLMPLAGRCEGLLLCGQMQGFVLVNGRGEPAGNFVSWLDQRASGEEFDEIRNCITSEERHQLGNELRPGIALPLLFWLKRHGALPRGNVTPVSIADMITARLCGTLPAMDPTQAAAFGALRLDTLAWHQQVIGKLGLDSLRWPEVRPSGSVAGTWRGIPCYAAVGDQQCSLAGALLRDRELSVNISTGSQVSLIGDWSPHEEHQTRPYFDGRSLRTITHIPAGRALGALVGLLTELGGAPRGDAWRQIETAVASVGSTDLRASIAFSPGPCGHAGFLENLHEGNMSIGHLFRAAFESMARNYHACARRLDPLGTAERVVFSGGVARRFEILRDLVGAALNLPYRLSPHPEDSLFGLLVLSLAFSGRQKSVRDAVDVINGNSRYRMETNNP